MESGLPIIYILGVLLYEVIRNLDLVPESGLE